MKIESLAIPDVKLLTPKIHADPRGFFVESWNRRLLQEHGIDIEFVQDNHSLSVPKGTVRGMHFQAPPFAQIKLVRCTRGSILDVAVDLRTGSPTFGQAVTAMLSAENMQQLLVPEGFAHGFCTLEQNTEVLYKVNAYYSAECDGGIAWDDQALGIDWPVTAEEVLLSEKDKHQPKLAQLDSPFRYQA
jgi:dTDP-4-dehydrorhamnose 3,5-epimerase